MSTIRSSDASVSDVVLKPKEIARMAAIGSDPEFGPLLAYRAVTRWPILLLLALPMLIGIFAAFEIVWHIANPPRPTRVPNPTQVGNFMVPAIVLVISCVLGGLVWRWYRGRDTEHRFFADGYELSSRRRGSRHRLSYMDVHSLTYKLSPQTTDVGISWLAGLIVLESTPGSRLQSVRLSFKHAAKAKGILTKQFDGGDPMDRVRDVVAQVVAERMALDIAEKGETPWTGSLSLTKDGLRSKPILGKPTLTPFEEVGRYEFKFNTFPFNEGVLLIFGRDGKKVLALPEPNGKNFWPGFVLFQRLVTPRGGAEEVDATEFEADGD